MLNVTLKTRVRARGRSRHEPVSVCRAGPSFFSPTSRAGGFFAKRDPECDMDLGRDVSYQLRTSILFPAPPPQLGRRWGGEAIPAGISRLSKTDAGRAVKDAAMCCVRGEPSGGESGGARSEV